jgi:hypothetical protein
MAVAACLMVLSESLYLPGYSIFSCMADSKFINLYSKSGMSNRTGFSAYVGYASL